MDANAARSQLAMDIALLQERIKLLDEWIVGLGDDYRRTEFQALSTEAMAATLSTLAAQTRKLQNIRAATFIELAKKIAEGA